MSTKVKPNRRNRRAAAAQQRKQPKPGLHGGGAVYERYVSSRGTAVHFYPMPPMLMEKIEVGVEAEFGPRPEPPTYTIKTAVGEDEVRTHTKETLDTPEDRAAWAAYEEELGVWESELSRRVLRAIQVECIKPADPDDTDWMEKQAFLGVPIPEGKYQRHLHWIETEFIGSNEDVVACMSIPMRLAGVPDEEMAAAEKLFRDSIQAQANRTGAAAG
ncbi:MAG: hypothetical protein IT327_02585 [Anaerolineae bacterium]|nr:hypothetical protein [Anaerolineae bacterium]